MEPRWPSDIGVLVIGHGTRDQAGLAEFAETVRQVAGEMEPTPVEPAFLELAEPSIRAGLDRLVQRGVRRIVAAPLLLFAAGHAKQDIPAELHAAVSQRRDVEWRQAEHLGCHPALLDLSTQRLREVIAKACNPLNRRRLIVVGRGSHDPVATQETARYAELLRERSGLDEVQVGFLAMSQPLLPAVLAEAANSACDTIIVQPHLLFSGELLREVRQLTQDWRQRVPAKQWLLSAHLGPAPQVVAAVIDRCAQSSFILR